MSTQGYNFGGQDTADPDEQLDALQTAIQDLHQLATVLTDPQATQIVMTCLAQLAKVQTTMMSQQSSPQQVIGQRLSGGAY